MSILGFQAEQTGAVYINCRGIGSCGTCAVEIQGEVQPAVWTTAEQLRLNFPPHSAPGNKRLRLACQVACSGGLLRVTKYDKFWGEGSAALPDLPSAHPVAAVAEAPEAPAGAGGAATSRTAAGGVTPLGELEFILDRGARQVEGRQQ